MKLQFDVAEPPELSVTLVGVHVAVRPVDGAIVFDIVRDPTNPLRLVSVTVEAPDEPAGNVTVEGLATILKSAGAITLTLIVTTCDKDPLVPVTVTV